VKRFRFPPETVRRWRQSREDLETARLQSLLAEVRRLELARRELKRQAEEAASALARTAGEGAGLDARAFADLDAFRVFVRLERERLLYQEEELRRRLEGQRAEVTKARRNRQLVDRLRDKAVAAWERDYAREIENDASDLYLSKWAGGGSGPLSSG